MSMSWNPDWEPVREFGGARAHGACGARSRREEEAMPGTSSTTSNADIAPQPPCALRVPGGVGASALLALLDDVLGIACVAPPRICPHGDRNATPPNSRTGSYPPAPCPCRS